MADVEIHEYLAGGVDWVGHNYGIIWNRSTLIGYVFTNDSQNGDHLIARKTIDGGQTWGAPIAVTGPDEPSNPMIVAWADWQTPGDNGDIIHIALTGAQPGQCQYLPFDTSDDTWGTRIATGTSGGSNLAGHSWRVQPVAISKNRAGDVGVASSVDDGSVSQDGFAVLINGDSSFTLKATVFDTQSVGSTPKDLVLLFPGNETDTQDFVAVYRDNADANYRLAKYDFSANTWTHEIAFASGIPPQADVTMNMTGTVRHSDGFVLFGFLDNTGSGNSDLEFWEIDTVNKVYTQKTNVLTAAPNCFTLAVSIDNTTDDLAMFYLGGDAADSFATSLHTRRRLSTDGGTTWDAVATVISANQRPNRAVQADISISGGRFMPLWTDDGFPSFTTKLETSFDTSIAVGGGPPTGPIVATPGITITFFPPVPLVATPTLTITTVAAGGGVVAQPTFTIGTISLTPSPGGERLIGKGIIEVDWDDDDIFSSFPDEDISKDVRRYTFDRGRDTELEDMPAGTLILTVNDTDGDYSPENTNTRFGSGNVTLNRRIRIRTEFDNVIHTMWQGRITSITPHPGRRDRTATIKAADEFEQFGRLDVEGPFNGEPQENVTIGSVLGPLDSLLNFLNFPVGDRIFDIGQTVLNLWWQRGENGLQALLALMEIEQGLAYIDREGKLRFEDRSHRLAGTTNPHRVSQFTFNSDMVEFDYDFSGRTVKNVARVTGHDRKVISPTPPETVIYATPTRPRIVANGTITVRATYSQPAKNTSTPTAPTDFRIDVTPDGTSSDEVKAALEANVSVSIRLHGQSKDITLTSSNATPVFVVPGDGVADPDTTLEIRGNLYNDDTISLEEGDEVVPTPSVAEFGKRSRDVDSEFISDPAFIQDLALFLKNRFEQPQPDFVKMSVEGSTPELLEALLTLEIHDRVTVVESQLQTSRDYFINRLEHTVDVDFGKILQVTYSLARTAGVGGAGGEEFWVLNDPTLGLLGITTILGF